MDTHKLKIDNLRFHFPYLEGGCTSWENVLNLAEPLLVKRNTVLSDMQRTSSDFFYVESGLFQVRYYAENGKIRCTTYFAKGTLLNVAAACVQDDVYLANMYCIKEAKIWRFDGNLFQDDVFFVKHQKLIREAFYQVSMNLLIHSVYTTDMLIDSPTHRVAKFLLGLHAEAKLNKISINFTQQDIADMLNLHRVTLTRILQDLKNEGLIDISPRSPIQVLDVSALRKHAGFI